MKGDLTKPLIVLEHMLNNFEARVLTKYFSLIPE